MKINNFENQINQVKPQTAFGSKASLSKKLLSDSALRKFSDAIEYNGFSMSSASLLGLFYFSVIFPRYIQAYDKYDRYEILRRDLISLTALAFLAQTLGKGFSEICQKTSGFVLNHKPEGFEKFGKKLWNYVNPASEFSALKSDQIVNMYSKVGDFKNGMADFCEAISKKGGNVKKVLSFNKVVKSNVEKILGKSIESAKYPEIVNALKSASLSNDNNIKNALKEIYKVFESPNNPFIKKAKFMNSFFGFLSTFLLVPSLIVWIAKSNERLTKARIAKELAVKEAQKQVSENPNTPVLNEVIKSAQNSSDSKTKETFAYFLGDK